MGVTLWMSTQASGVPLTVLLLIASMSHHSCQPFHTLALVSYFDTGILLWYWYLIFGTLGVVTAGFSAGLGSAIVTRVRLLRSLSHFCQLHIRLRSLSSYITGKWCFRVKSCTDLIYFLVSNADRCNFSFSKYISRMFTHVIFQSVAIWWSLWKTGSLFGLTNFLHFTLIFNFLDMSDAELYTDALRAMMLRRYFVL